jgi:hypothetical protein
MRINQIISQPTSSFQQRSAVENEVVKRVLGTVPVNADGSVAFEAPAATAMQFQLLDANGMAVMTMRSLVYLQPGEKASCVGCHEPRENSPSASLRPNPPIQQITPPPGPRYDGGFSFVRTVQPVLDRYCVGCHAPGKTPRDIDLTGVAASARLAKDAKDAKDGKALPRDGKRESKREIRPSGCSAAYESLTTLAGLVKLAHRNAESTFSKPKDYFSHASKLAPMLLAGHPDKEGKKRVQLDAESFQRLAEWLDLNCQFYGDYSFNRIENQPPVAEAEKALRQAVEKRFGADQAGLPYAMLVNVANVGASRILMAPLPAAAGGWGQIDAGAYRGTDDPAYVEMRKLAEATVRRMEYHDIASTCGHDKGCSCGNCWVRKYNEGIKSAHQSAGVNGPAGVGGAGK